ncbi:hypothetical protein SISSUDRAFT_1052394 [Sistotremastrum suecicum HHB10207 ss-3]|uniref:Uncharacterized protein n=1 Tax=Sistotremastrum suecicum HHB10207 ss-3 TaxID=1314776 RepID=A0A165ZW68_9AGAM|nr:hypothetical protein SISSUDRAFT_1052394 [Sistotremastrum suecicum HHB10207 ss-3]
MMPPTLVVSSAASGVFVSVSRTTPLALSVFSLFVAPWITCIGISRSGFDQCPSSTKQLGMIDEKVRFSGDDTQKSRQILVYFRGQQSDHRGIWVLW